MIGKCKVCGHQAGVFNLQNGICMSCASKSSIGSESDLSIQDTKPSTTVTIDSPTQAASASTPPTAAHHSTGKSPTTGSQQGLAKWFWAMICFLGAIFLWVCGGLLIVLAGQEFLGSQEQFRNADSNSLIMFLVAYAVIVTVVGYWASRSNLMFLYMLALGFLPAVFTLPGWGSFFVGLETLKRGEASRKLKISIIQILSIVIFLWLVLYLTLP